MSQLSIQFEHQLIDACLVLPDTVEDPEAQVESAQSTVPDVATEELAPQIQPESDDTKTHMQLKQAVDLVASQLAQIQNERTMLRKELADRFDLIAVRVAEFVFREDAGLAESRLRHCLKLALETLDQQSEILVAVHPSQRDLILEALNDLPHADCLNISPDEQIGIGDCRVEQNGQGLYASLENQLARVADEISELFDGERKSL